MSTASALAAATSLCGPLTPLDLPALPYHGVQILYWIGAVAVADVISRRVLFPEPGVRWFFLHALANLIVTLASAQDVWGWLTSPMCSMVVAHHSWAPTHIAFALHLYHLVAFTKLRMDDIVHHLLFVGGFCVLNFAWAWGRMVNVLLFFITGLPGGTTYALLVLVKTGRMGVLREKAISADLNTWLRTPGLIAFATVICSCAAHRLSFVPVPAMLTCAALASLNGLYYGAQVRGNCTAQASVHPLAYNIPYPSPRCRLWRITSSAGRLRLCACLRGRQRRSELRVRLMQVLLAAAIVYVHTTREKLTTTISARGARVC